MDSYDNERGDSGQAARPGQPLSGERRKGPRTATPHPRARANRHANTHARALASAPRVWDAMRLSINVCVHN